MKAAKVPGVLSRASWPQDFPRALSRGKMCCHVSQRGFSVKRVLPLPAWGQRKETILGKHGPVLFLPNSYPSIDYPPLQTLFRTLLFPHIGQEDS